MAIRAPDGANKKLLIELCNCSDQKSHQFSKKYELVHAEILPVKVWGAFTRY